MRTIRKPESLPVGMDATDIMLDAICILACNRNDEDAQKIRIGLARMEECLPLRFVFPLPFLPGVFR